MTTNAILHAKRWDIYMNNRRKHLLRGGYHKEVSGSDGKKFFWGAVDNHVVEDGKEHDEIGFTGGFMIIFLKNTTR